MADNFELLFSVKANNTIPVFKYKSKKTGLTVCIAQVEGPLVNGYFCLATEAHDDDGLPHTLEHVIFMGSEQYPYKGVLDLLANRCLASGTNAWTDTDHTCYTMMTAGSEGFLKLMPIYLDHVLYPTITGSSYVTEVHHINGEGEDAGVVYCEMQACQNTGENRTHHAMLQEMYPGHCGYKSETGGKMENLRTSTSHKKVCDYHRSFYRPDNLCLVISGQVEPSEVFKALAPFEERIVSKGALPPHTRPWQSTVPPVPKPVELVMPYPSDDESLGMVRIAWRGPKAKEQYKCTSLLVLLEYLTDTAISPLQRDFVEIESPLCSNVRYSIIENSECCVYLTFENVPKEKLSCINDRALGLLKKIAMKTEEIDMKRMKSVIHRRVLESLDHIEDRPHDTFAFIIIGDFLYGDTKEELEERINQINSFKKLKTENQDYWHNLLNEYFVGKNSVTIIGEPSKKLQEDMANEEKKRVEEQRKVLGEKGLKEKSDTLEKAIEENETEAPETMITSVDVPSVGCIKFHPINTSHNQDSSAANRIQELPLADMPVTFQLDDIHTNFVQMYALMDTGDVPPELRYYMPLWTEVIFESPVMRKGVLVSHEEIIAQLAADTLFNTATLGLSGSRFRSGIFAQVVTVGLKVEVDKYQKGVEWLHELLFRTQFTADRLKTVASKMANDVARMKRKGNMVVLTVLNDINLKRESNHCVNNMMRQHKFLTEILQKLESNPQEVIDNMNKLRAVLTEPSNITVHVSADVKQLATVVKQPNLPWQQGFVPEGAKKPSAKPAVKPTYELLNPIGQGPGSGVIVGVGAVESSYMIQTVPGLTSYTHEDLPAIQVYIQYLTQLEGPMWRQIRGLGLSYHYSMYLKEESGLLYFTLQKSTHIVNAYKQAKEIVDGYLSGSTAFSEVELETSKSSLIFEIIEQETTVGDTAKQSLYSYYKKVDTDYNRQLLNKVAKVTLADLKRVGTKYIAPLFDTSKSRCAICCNPSKVEEIKQDFQKQFGRELKVLESLEEGFLAEM